MLVRIQNKYNKETSSFEENEFQVYEGDKTIYGQFRMTRKNKEGKYFSGTMGFVSFKSQIDAETGEVLMSKHGGRLIDVQGELGVTQGKDGKTYFQLVINQAQAHAGAQGLGNVDTSKVKTFPSKPETFDEIPF